MSICNPCTKLKPVSFCNSETGNVINLGTKTGADLGSGLYVYFKSTATGAIYIFPVINSYNAAGGGLNTMEIDFDDNFPLATETGYEIWINDPGSSSPEDKISFTIGGITSDCFLFSGSPIAFNLEDQVNEVFDQQTLQIAG